MPKLQRDGRFTGQLRRLLPALIDLGQVDVGYEIVGVGALEREHFDALVSLSSLNERKQIADQLRPSSLLARAKGVPPQGPSSLAHRIGVADDDILALRDTRSSQ
jgi:hypothetical protein